MFKWLYNQFYPAWFHLLHSLHILAVCMGAKWNFTNNIISFDNNHDFATLYISATCFFFNWQAGKTVHSTMQWNITPWLALSKSSSASSGSPHNMSLVKLVFQRSSPCCTSQVDRIYHYNTFGIALVRCYVFYNHSCTNILKFSGFVFIKSAL